MVEGLERNGLSEAAFFFLFICNRCFSDHLLLTFEEEGRSNRHWALRDDEKDMAVTRSQARRLFPSLTVGLFFLFFFFSSFREEDEGEQGSGRL